MVTTNDKQKNVRALQFASQMKLNGRERKRAAACCLICRLPDTNKTKRNDANDLDVGLANNTLTQICTRTLCGYVLVLCMLYACVACVYWMWARKKSGVWLNNCRTSAAMYLCKAHSTGQQTAALIFRSARHVQTRAHHRHRRARVQQRRSDSKTGEMLLLLFAVLCAGLLNTQPETRI